MAATVSAHRKGNQFAGWKKMIGGYRFYFGEAWGITNESKAGKAIASRAATLLEREYSAAKISEGGWTDQNKAEALDRVRAAMSVPKPNPKPTIDLNTWMDMMAMTAVQLRRLSYYALRRTGAQAVRRIGGYEVSKIYLAHSSLEKSGSQSVSEKHYTERTPEDSERVALALRCFREQLQPIFDAGKKADAVKAANGQKSAA